MKIGERFFKFYFLSRFFLVIYGTEIAKKWKKLLHDTE